MQKAVIEIELEESGDGVMITVTPAGDADNLAFRLAKKMTEKILAEIAKIKGDEK